MVDDEDELLGDGLLEDLEEWDKMFDSLHLPDAPEAAAAAAAAARPQPATVPPPPAMSRPGATVPAPPVLPRTQAPTRPAPPPTAFDDESDPFPLPGEELTIGEPRALGALLGSAGRRPAGDEEDSLFTSAVRPPGTTGPAAPGAPRPPATVRRSAAIVRRPGTGAKKPWPTWTDKTRPGPGLDAAPGQPAPGVGPDHDESADFWPEERTEAVASELVERLAESAEALFRDAPPEVSLELDEDFYEGIEVAATESPLTASEPEPAGPVAEGTAVRRSRPPTGESLRRTTSNIVRRAATPVTSEPPLEARPRPLDTTAPPPSAPHSPRSIGASDFDDVEDPTVVVGELAAGRTGVGGDLPRDLVQSSAPRGSAQRRARRTTPPWDSPWDAAPEPPEPETERRRAITPWDAVAEAAARERASQAEVEPETIVRGPAPWEAPAETLQGVAPWEKRLPRAGTDADVDAALDEAVAIDDGTLMSTATVVQLTDIDVAPDLPLSPFAVSEPTIDFSALSVSDAEPTSEDRTEELARDLLLYERELVLLDEPVPTARMRLEAGRLAEQLGDLDRARTHYDIAMQVDPQLRPPLRALRRVERQLGNFTEAVRHLDAEIELASSRERRALAAYRADLLMAIGEQDVARVAIGDLVDEAPADVRALLADLELAWVDGRNDELDVILDQLAQAVADRALAGAMARTRGLLAEARGEDGGAAFRGALLVDPADRLAWMGLAHAAAARGAPSEAAELTGHLVGQGGLGQAAPALGGALEWRRGEPLIGRGELAAATRSISRAAELLPGDPELGEVHALLLEAGGQADAAAGALERAAGATEWQGQAARFLRRAATLRAAGGDTAGSLPLLRRAVELDPGEPLAAIDLAGALEAAGDDEGLVGLARRQVSADPDGAVLARLRLARGLDRLGRREEAAAVLAAGRDVGPRSAALDAALERAYTRGARLAERAALAREQADEKLPYVDLELAERRAALALEQLARAGGAAAPPSAGLPSASVQEADPGLADTIAPRDAAEPDEGWPDPATEAAMPEILFAAPSQHDGKPEAAGLPAGIWREPSAGASGTVSHAAAAPGRREALAAWRRVLAMNPDSAAARTAVMRLAEAALPVERLTILAEAQRGEVPPAWSIELALRRADLLAGAADGDAAQVLAAAAQLDADDPRPTVALLRHLAGAGKWTEAAALLTDRADALGGDQAIGLRYSAASILLDRTDDARRAVDLLTSTVHARPDFVIAAELLRAAQRRSGESAPAVEAVAAMPTADRPDTDDGFARFLREAEVVELQVGDPGRAADLYRRALQLRPDDPLARDGFARNAERAGEAAPLAELALADLKQAEAMGDGAAKATAYEELARIDAELRGDLASAILGWSAAVDADPGRMTAMRSLERAYLAGDRDREPDLYQLYVRMAGALTGPRDTVDMLGELARLAERTGRPRDEVLGYFRRVREIDPMARMALFRLEANARAEGPSRELAELEQAVARALSGDARAEAAFYTRAGETLLALGDREEAVKSFRAAVTALPDHLPALHGWRDAAAAGGMWLDVAEAASRAAEASAAPEERSALHHLAGVVLMDRVPSPDAGERAIGAFRRVLDADPAHTDAFLRLKLLYEETGQDVELVELFHGRLAVETEPDMRVALHQGMSDLYRNFFDDRDGARRHLKSALAIDADNLRAIADLSDIAWEMGDWAEAAEALIARARLESRPEVLRQIFYRLGMIYADRLPDPRYAMMSFQKVLTYHPGDTGALERVADLAARSGDHRLALGACEQLIKLATADADKVVHLHRVARVYLDGLHDRQKAERAYRIALDMDPTSDAALAALVDFYGEVGDNISARVHLDRVAGSMRQRLAADPAQVQPYRVLARALEARERAGVPGSLATARCAAEIAVLFGSTDARDAELAAGAARSRPPLAGLSAADVDDLLFPAPLSSSLRALFRMLGERLAKQLGIDVRRYGVGRAERLRPGDPLAAMILEMAGEMGIPELDIYLSQRQPTALAVEPTSPPSLVIGAQLASLDRPAELRFLVGRALKLSLCSLAVPARLGVEELGALVAGMVRQFQPEFTPAGLDPAHVAAEQQKLRRLIPSNMVQELAPFGLDIAAAGAEFDHRALWGGIINGGNRAGLLAAGGVGAASGALLRLGGYRDIHQGVADAFVAGLLRFAVSEDHAALRAELGA
jgi:tetratricopeptide (TPR) repeat protein